MSVHQFHQVIPWHILKAHLEQQKSALATRIFKARDDKELYRLQGQGELFEALLNLPETLETLAIQDELEREKK